MIHPIDVWTIGHSIVGFFSGRIKLRRLLFYPLPVIWEIYQLFFHYQPKGEYLKDTWLNSLIDIFTCLLLYEIAVRYDKFFELLYFWSKVSKNVKSVAVYIFIVLTITWVFWDDVFRLNLSTGMPCPLVPIILGSFSPLAASFMIRNWVLRTSPDNRLYLLKIFKNRLYYPLAGITPSLITLFIMYLITGFRY